MAPQIFCQCLISETIKENKIDFFKENVQINIKFCHVIILKSQEKWKQKKFQPKKKQAHF